MYKDFEEFQKKIRPYWGKCNFTKNNSLCQFIIDKCPTCGQKLREIMDSDGVFIARRCDRCGCNWSIFDLEIKETKKINLEKWLE